MNKNEWMFPRSSVPNPCYGCEKRSAECHAHCKEHAEASELKRLEREEIKARKRADADVENYSALEAIKNQKRRRLKNSK